MRSIQEIVRCHARVAPDHPALADISGRAVTYAGLNQFIEQSSTDLNLLGVGPGDRVAVVLADGFQMALMLVSVASAAICAPLNPNYRFEEFRYYLSDLKAKALITAAGADSPAIDAARELGLLLIRLHQGDRIDEIRLESDQRRDAVKGSESDPSSLALLLHTSGTTSRPKLVPLTQHNLLSSAGNIAKSLELSERDRCLMVMPLFHVHGIAGGLLSSLTAGASVVCAPGFRAPDFLSWLEALQPTWYSAAPTMHQSILSRARTLEPVSPVHTLRLIRSSSAPLAVAVINEIERVFQVPLIEAYGMTEASQQISINPLPPLIRKPGSVGRAAGTELSIIDERATHLAAGQSGEIVVKGASIMSGYEDNPDANAAAFSDGWFRTGDLGYLDSDGYLYIQGRLKEQINRGGEKISPREIDEALARHEAIQQAVAFAVPDDLLGEDVGAAVVLKDGWYTTAHEIKQFAAAHLAHFKVPSRIVFVEELPRGSTGKLQRIGLAAQLGITGNGNHTQESLQFVPPDGETEQQLAAIWREVLKVQTVGANDHFLELGGDSILATLVVSRVRSFLGFELGIVDFFEFPTVRDLARLIASQAEAEPGTIAGIANGSEVGRV